LAVTAETRADVLPDVSAVGEYLPGFEVTARDGTCAPRSTPAAVIDTLNTAINQALPIRG
jgi:tripartite-type tricarboxylate transporter receptor subunit TctC